MNMATRTKKILLVQSRSRTDKIEAEQDGYRAALKGIAKLECLSALDESLSWRDPHKLVSAYGGIIFGGSSDYDFDGGRMAKDPFRLLSMIILSRTKNLITYATEEKIPVLGVCFGHQLIANMHGGEVKNDPKQKKSGTFEVILTDEGKKDPLLGEMPEKFLAQYGHKDSVTKLPKGAVVLAKNKDCRFSVLRYGATTYTAQFHPELTGTRAINSLNDVEGYLPDNVSDASKIVRESPEASKIIPLWIEKIVTA